MNTTKLREYATLLRRWNAFELGRQREGSNSPMTAKTLAPYSTTSGTSIQHTVRYTELSPQRFRDFWKD